MAGPSRIDELRKKFDENPRRYFAPLANEYRKIGDFEQAIFICQEFLPQQPGHMSGHIVYGQALFESGRHDEARSVFETALALDPENLIALRHLGDIARAHGDNETARAWYRRVLDSDPRNEEIAGILGSLDGDGTSDFAPPPQQATTSATGAADGVAIESTAIESPMDAITQGSSAAAATSPDPIVTEPLTSAPAESSFDDIAKLFTSPPAETPASEPLSDGHSGSFSFVHEGEDVLGRAAQMLDVPQSRAPSEPANASPTPTELPLDALSALGQGQSPASSSAPLPFLESLTPSEAAAPTPPAIEPSPAKDASTAFVTETMAELYVQQGHQDLAIDVYRQLVKLRPDDGALSTRLRELEGGAKPAADAATTEAPSAEVVAEAGPTIRDFLIAIAGFRPRSEGAAPNGTSAQYAETTSPTIPAAETAREETVGGSLQSLFSGAERSKPSGTPALDSIVGVTTSMSPADLPSTKPETIPGRPTAPATTELSLDHVFRHATPAAGTAAQSNFSFDQFFSQKAQQDVAAADVEPPTDGAAGEGDDIQQFNAWLEGLKKT